MPRLLLAPIRGLTLAFEYPMRGLAEFTETHHVMQWFTDATTFSDGKRRLLPNFDWSSHYSPTGGLSYFDYKTLGPTTDMRLALRHRRPRRHREQPLPAADAGAKSPAGRCRSSTSCVATTCTTTAPGPPTHQSLALSDRRRVAERRRPPPAGAHAHRRRRRPRARSSASASAATTTAIPPSTTSSACASSAAASVGTVDNRLVPGFDQGTQYHARRPSPCASTPASGRSSRVPTSSAASPSTTRTALRRRRLSYFRIHAVAGVVGAPVAPQPRQLVFRARRARRADQRHVGAVQRAADARRDPTRCAASSSAACAISRCSSARRVSLADLDVRRRVALRRLWRRLRANFADFSNAPHLLGHRHRVARLYASQFFVRVGVAYGFNGGGWQFLVSRRRRMSRRSRLVALLLLVASGLHPDGALRRSRDPVALARRSADAAAQDGASSASTAKACATPSFEPGRSRARRSTTTSRRATSTRSTSCPTRPGSTIRAASTGEARPRRLTQEEVERGALGPTTSRCCRSPSPRARTSARTPGFVAVDARGVKYLVKLDPRENFGLTTQTELVVERAWRGRPAGSCRRCRSSTRSPIAAAGVAQGLRRRTTTASKQPFYDDAQLRHDDRAHAARQATARVRLLVSRWLAGVNIGEFAYNGRVKDDPNDLVDHEDRRDLRGFGVFCAWVNDVDTLQNNTLDMYEGEPGQGHVVHYQQDSAARSATSPAWSRRSGGHRDLLGDAASSLRSLFTLGLAPRRGTIPTSSATRTHCAAQVARARATSRRRASWPRSWQPIIENPAFARQTRRDRYWGAKRVAAFDGDEMRAAIAAGRYRPEAAVYLFAVLSSDGARSPYAYFSETAALDHFEMRGRTLCFDDLWLDAGLGDGASYRSSDGAVRGRCVALVGARRLSHRRAARATSRRTLAFPASSRAPRHVRRRRGTSSESSTDLHMCACAASSSGHDLADEVTTRSLFSRCHVGRRSDGDDGGRRLHGDASGKASPDDPAGNFYQVSDTVYRGGRPDGAGVLRLADMGIKTIIDLENDDNAVAAGAASGRRTPASTSSHEPMVGARDAARQRGRRHPGEDRRSVVQPVYVHCTEGVDRTGLIIALYRVIEAGLGAQGRARRDDGARLQEPHDRDEQLLREEDRLGRLIEPLRTPSAAACSRARFGAPAEPVARVLGRLALAQRAVHVAVGLEGQGARFVVRDARLIVSGAAAAPTASKRTTGHEACASRVVQVVCLAQGVYRPYNLSDGGRPAGGVGFQPCPPTSSYSPIRLPRTPQDGDASGRAPPPNPAAGERSDGRLDPPPKRRWRLLPQILLFPFRALFLGAALSRRRRAPLRRQEPSGRAPRSAFSRWNDGARGLRPAFYYSTIYVPEFGLRYFDHLTPRRRHQPLAHRHHRRRATTSTPGSPSSRRGTRIRSASSSTCSSIAARDLLYNGLGSHTYSAAPAGRYLMNAHRDAPGAAPARAAVAELLRHASAAGSSASATATASATIPASSTSTTRRPSPASTAAPPSCAPASTAVLDVRNEVTRAVRRASSCKRRSTTRTASPATTPATSGCARSSPCRSTCGRARTSCGCRRRPGSPGPTTAGRSRSPSCPRSAAPPICAAFASRTFATTRRCGSPPSIAGRCGCGSTARIFADYGGVFGAELRRLRRAPHAAGRRRRACTSSARARSGSRVQLGYGFGEGLNFSISGNAP